MSIIIHGENKGIAVEGDLRIDHLDFQFGQGVKSASGIHRELPEAEIVEEMPIVDIREKQYPAITDVQRNFLETAFVIKGTVFGQKPTILDMPVECHAHHYGLTEEWRPETSVHKWKVLYETLLRMKYFRIEQRHRYVDYVKAIVRYCFPDVADSYSNNLSKSRLEEHFDDWSNDDKALYRILKEALTFQK